MNEPLKFAPVTSVPRGGPRSMCIVGNAYANGVSARKMVSADDGYLRVPPLMLKRNRFLRNKDIRGSGQNCK
jgi:hypothetical protein